jgi:aldose 1-epimerase
MTSRLLTAAALTALAGLAVADAPKGGKTMSAGLKKSDFGKAADGQAVDLYTLTNANGMTVKVTNYGGIITEIQAPDRTGKFADVALGFDNLDGYLNPKHPFFGATVGRVANRVAKGRFTLDGKTYMLAVNNGLNALHGGTKGFDKVVWKAAENPSPDGPSVRMTYVSKDGEEGYPGNLTAAVTFTVTADNGLKLDYAAQCDKATPINLTNHSYFNLGGPNSGDILGHVMMINADQYTPTDDTLIPTGVLAPVKGTPLDFTKPTPIGAHLKEIHATPVGYDHNFVLNGNKPAVRVKEPKSGRVMEMTTTEPGVQFYTGNFLDGTLTGKGGTVYKQYTGFCLEAQHFPDSVNHPNFPSVILQPGKTYTQTTVYKFSAEK